MSDKAHSSAENPHWITISRAKYPSSPLAGHRMLIDDRTHRVLGGSIPRWLWGKTLGEIHHASDWHEPTNKERKRAIKQHAMTYLHEAPMQDSRFIRNFVQMTADKGWATLKADHKTMKYGEILGTLMRRDVISPKIGYQLFQRMSRQALIPTIVTPITQQEITGWAEQEGYPQDISKALGTNPRRGLMDAVKYLLQQPKSQWLPLSRGIDYAMNRAFASVGATKTAGKYSISGFTTGLGQNYDTTDPDRQIGHKIVDKGHAFPLDKKFFDVDDGYTPTLYHALEYLHHYAPFQDIKKLARWIVGLEDPSKQYAGIVQYIQKQCQERGIAMEHVRMARALELYERMFSTDQQFNEDVLNRVHPTDAAGAKYLTFLADRTFDLSVFHKDEEDRGSKRRIGVASSNEAEQIKKMIETTAIDKYQIDIHVRNVYTVNYQDPAFDEAKHLYGNTKLLFHGTSNANVIKILGHGFGLPGEIESATGSMFGPGIYWAENSTKSSQYTDARRGVLIIGEVVLGKMFNALTSGNFNWENLQNGSPAAVVSQFMTEKTPQEWAEFKAGIDLIRLSAFYLDLFGQSDNPQEQSIREIKEGLSTHNFRLIIQGAERLKAKINTQTNSQLQAIQAQVDEGLPALLGLKKFSPRDFRDFKKWTLSVYDHVFHPYGKSELTDFIEQKYPNSTPSGKLQWLLKFFPWGKDADTVWAPAQSVMGSANTGLYNKEYVVYKRNQVKIRYLVDIDQAENEE